MTSRTSATAIIRIGAVADSSIARALNGTVDATRKVNARIAADTARNTAQIEATKARQTAAGIRLQLQLDASANKQRARNAADLERTKAKQAADGAKLQIQISQDAEKAKQAAMQQTARVAERLANMQRRESEKTARGQIRDAEKAAKAEQRAAKETSEFRRRLLISGGAAVVAGGAVIKGRIDSVAGTFGVQSPEQKMATIVDMRRRAARVADMTGGAVSADTLVKTSLDTSAQGGGDASQVMEALEIAQNQFSELGGAAEAIRRMPLLKDLSLATGAGIPGLTQALGVMQRQFKLTSEETDTLIGTLVDSGDVGNINPEELADKMSAALGALGRGAGLSGLKGAGTALGITQVIGASDMPTERVQTTITNLVTSLNAPMVRKGMKEQFGVSLAGKDGELRDIPTIVSELSKAGFSKSSSGIKRHKAVEDTQAQAGWAVMVKQFEADPALFTRLMTPNAVSGNESIVRRAAAVQAGVLGTASTMGARDLQTFANAENFDALAKTSVEAADGLTQIKAAYPLLSEALGVATAAVGTFSASLLAQSLFIRGGKLPVPALLPGAVPGVVPGAVAAAGGASVLAMLGIGAAAVTATALAAWQLLGEDSTIAGFGEIGEKRRIKAESDRLTAVSRAIPMPAAAKSFDMMADASRAALGVVADMQKNPPQASLTIKVEGPGKVTKADTSNFGVVDLNTGTGRMDLYL